MAEKICCKGIDGKNCEFDGVWFCQNPDCKTKVLTSTLPGAHPSGCPKVDSWNSKGLKLPCDCCGKETETLFKIPRYEVGTSDIKVSNANKQQLCAECAKSLCDFINGFSKCSCGKKEGNNGQN